MVEILFPVFCIECKKEGEWWCEQCWAKLKLAEIQSCPVCGIKTNRGEVCEKCLAVSCLNGITAFFNYQEDSSLAKLLKQFKYQWANDMVGVWEKIIGGICHPERRPPQAAVVEGSLDSVLSRIPFIFLPIPLHLRRLRERGFNQAEVFAKIFYKELKQKGWQVNFDNLSLCRIRNTKQQAKLTGAERRKNMGGAFKWIKKQPAPAFILLFDDVFTTGATMQECARVLKENGAKIVWGVAMARG